MKFLSGKCHSTPMMISQHWFKWWHQAIAWANVYADMTTFTTLLNVSTWFCQYPLLFQWWWVRLRYIWTSPFRWILQYQRHLRRPVITHFPTYRFPARTSSRCAWAARTRNVCCIHASLYDAFFSNQSSIIKYKYPYWNIFLTYILQSNICWLVEAYMHLYTLPSVV